MVILQVYFLLIKTTESQIMIVTCLKDWPCDYLNNIDQQWSSSPFKFETSGSILFWFVVTDHDAVGRLNTVGWRPSASSAEPLASSFRSGTRS